MSQINFDHQGLTEEQVLRQREEHGYNRLDNNKENGFLKSIKGLAKEPMVLLLLLASSVYFITGNTGDGVFLASAIVLVACISLYQDARSRNALMKLQDFTTPACQVIRDGKVQEIKSEEVVVGDYLMVGEGSSIVADGTIIQSNDFSVNESILTGESLPVFKEKVNTDNKIYCGTTVATGLAISIVTAIGNETKLGKIGSSLKNIKESKTPLETQIRNFVLRMTVAGAIVFFIVWIINYFRSHDLLDSLLRALTLAMSILPEEIPVAFTTFMALGSWRLMKMGIVVKQMKTVETLGSATVICTDKTGTLTENKMSLAKLYVLSGNKISNADNALSNEEMELIRVAMWASEPIPFDPMEIALHNAYKDSVVDDESLNYKMIHEYPLDGRPPMMTHIFENEKNNRIIAAKGAPEALMKVSNLTPAEKDQIESALKIISSDGYRVLGVGETIFTGSNFPVKQQEFQFKFNGLVAFHDPPKKNIQSVLNNFYAAGIKVKLVTGDNPATASAIAKQIGFKGFDIGITGDELLKVPESQLQEKVAETYVFTRMFPEAKLKIINALKAKKEIVAMTGDGVNDGPALKAAHIGIAMGKKGTEIAKQSASLILVEDDLAKMVDAIAMGRKIYANLKKAIQYIISIHIPIILTVFIPLALGWIYPNIFSPVHVIFLELIMGPTCSIMYENEPLEKNTMIQPPRPFMVTFFNWKELATSIVQGLMITAGSLFIYQYAVDSGFNEFKTRTMVFTTLIASNIFLTLVNRSFYYSVITTLKYKNNLVLIIIGLTFLITALLLFVIPFSNFFQFEQLNFTQIIYSIVTGFISVIWFEVIKWYTRMKSRIHA